MAQELGRLQREGQLPDDLDVDLVARAYLSMEVGMLLWWLEDSRRASAAALVDTLARLHPAIAARRTPDDSRSRVGRDQMESHLRVRARRP